MSSAAATCRHHLLDQAAWLTGLKRAPGVLVSKAMGMMGIQLGS